jgi:exodeoxyribonuclease III
VTGGADLLAQPADELRLMTWNVQHAAPTRAHRQAAWLAGHDGADVLVLTEVSNSAGGRALVQALRAYGYEVIVPDSTGNDFMVVVAARAGQLEAVPIRVGHLPHRLVAVRVQVSMRTVGVVGLYVPSRGPQQRRNQDKRAFQQAVGAELPHLAMELGCEPIVVAEDLNVVEPGHQPHYAVFGEWEYRFYEKFAACGLVDAFRALHPHAIEHSWLGRSGNGYRFDHIFVTREHHRLLGACGYLHQPRLDGLSDHAAMTVTLAFDQVGLGHSKPRA